MKRQRSYTDETGLEHFGSDYQDEMDRVEEGRSEEEREEKAERKPCYHEHKTFNYDIGRFVCDDCNEAL